MGEVNPAMQQPSSWARIRGCLAAVPNEEGVDLFWVARAGAPPRRITAEEAPALLERGAWIASVLPAQRHVLKTVEAPFASVGKAARVFGSLLELDLPFPLESCRTAYLAPRRTPGGKSAALAAAAREEDIATCLATLDRLSLRPMSLDLEGLALWDEWQRRDPQGFREPASMLAWAGPDRLVVLFSRAGTFADMSVYRVEPGAPQAGETANRLLRKVRSLPGFEKWIWSWAGPRAEDESFRDAMETALAGDGGDFPVRRIPGGKDMLESAIARRLLTRGGGRCNLLEPGEAAPAVGHALRRRDRTAGAWMALSGAALLSVSAATLIHSNRMADGLRDEINRTYTALTGQPNVQAPGTEALVAARMLQDPAGGAFQRAFDPGAQPLLRELLRVGLSQAAAFGRIEWKDGRLTARGTVSDPSSASRIREAIEPFGLRCHVRVGSELQPGRMAAEITAERDGEGLP